MFYSSSLESCQRNKKGSWKPHWKELFQSLQNIVPQDYLVIVSADRGLYADWLYQEIVALGWHPFLRINHQGQYLSMIHLHGSL